MYIYIYKYRYMYTYIYTKVVYSRNKQLKKHVRVLINPS